MSRSSAVESPCIGACTLDQHDVCTGCRRTLDEIARWRDLSDVERRRVLARCAGRDRAPGLSR